MTDRAPHPQPLNIRDMNGVLTISGYADPCQVFTPEDREKLGRRLSLGSDAMTITPLPGETLECYGPTRSLHMDPCMIATFGELSVRHRPANRPGPGLLQVMPDPLVGRGPGSRLSDDLVEMLLGVRYRSPSARHHP